MRVHWLQHVEFEGLGLIASWAEKNGHELTVTRFWAGDELPDPDNVRMLVAMGGPMGVYDEEDYGWLRSEKQFIRAAADNGAGILGVCLGAQLVAEVFGASVYKNKEKEIGWYPVRGRSSGPDWLARLFSGEPCLLHWHGDTFDIPAGGSRFCSSVGCVNQGFIIGDRIIGLQFHLEMTRTDVQRLISNCRDELVPGGAWIQSESDLLAGAGDSAARERILYAILDHLREKSRDQ